MVQEPLRRDWTMRLQRWRQLKVPQLRQRPQSLLQNLRLAREHLQAATIRANTEAEDVGNSKREGIFLGVDWFCQENAEAIEKIGKVKAAIEGSAKSKKWTPLFSST
jgi:hypothetical protein